MTRDGLSLFYRTLLPDEEKARVVIAHGLGEHSGRYRNVFDTLLPEGFGCFALDHRGHGQSAGKRGHVLSFSEYVVDLKSFVELARKDLGEGKKLFLLGHSMGGLIAISFALTYPTMIDGLVVSSPLLGMKVAVPPLKEAMGKLMSTIWPGLTLSNELDPTKISHDEFAITAYQDDPLVHDRVSARWFTQIVAAMEKAQAQASELKVPILMQVAGDDCLVNAPSSKEFFEKVTEKDRTFIVYEGLYHEIYNEVEDRRKEVLATLAPWLKDRLS